MLSLTLKEKHIYDRCIFSRFVKLLNMQWSQCNTCCLTQMQIFKNSLKTLLDRQVDVYSAGLYVIKTTLPSYSIFNWPSKAMKQDEWLRHTVTLGGKQQLLLWKSLFCIEMWGFSLQNRSLSEYASVQMHITSCPSRSRPKYMKAKCSQGIHGHWLVSHLPHTRGWFYSLLQISSSIQNLVPLFVLFTLSA